MQSLADGRAAAAEGGVIRANQLALIRDIDQTSRVSGGRAGA